MDIQERKTTVEEIAAADCAAVEILHVTPDPLSVRELTIFECDRSYSNGQNKTPKWIDIVDGMRHVRNKYVTKAEYQNYSKELRSKFKRF